MNAKFPGQSSLQAPLSQGSRPEQKIPSQPGSFPKPRGCTSSCRRQSPISDWEHRESRSCVSTISLTLPQVKRVCVIRPAVPGGQELNHPRLTICLPHPSSGKE